MTRTLFLLFPMMVLIGCGKPTEEQRLAKFRGSLKYKTYCLASEKATRLLVAEYNKKSAQSLTDQSAHATLGIVWFLAEKSEYSFIEADILGKAEDTNAKTFSLGLKSIALSKMKCPNLSRAHYDDLKALLAVQRGGDTNSIEVEHKLLLLSLIAVGLYHGDTDLAKYGADALGAISQLDYLPPLIGAVVEAKKGNPLKAVTQLRELSKSDRFSAHKKALMAEVADIIAKCPDKDKLGEELVRRVLLQLVQRVLDDIFAAEDQRALLQKLKSMPAQMRQGSSRQSR
jgi:hypothetical protein